jgi:hypothetical protein
MRKRKNFVILSQIRLQLILKIRQKEKTSFLKLGEKNSSMILLMLNHYKYLLLVEEAIQRVR